MRHSLIFKSKLDVGAGISLLSCGAALNSRSETPYVFTGHEDGKVGTRLRPVGAFSMALARADGTL